MRTAYPKPDGLNILYRGNMEDLRRKFRYTPDSYPGPAVILTGYEDTLDLNWAVITQTVIAAGLDPRVRKYTDFGGLRARLSLEFDKQLACEFSCEHSRPDFIVRLPDRQIVCTCAGHKTWAERLYAYDMDEPFIAIPINAFVFVHTL